MKHKSNLQSSQLSVIDDDDSDAQQQQSQQIVSKLPHDGSRPNLQGLDLVGTPLDPKVNEQTQKVMLRKGESLWTSISSIFGR